MPHETRTIRIFGHYAVALEEATLEIRDSDSLLGTAILTPVYAPAGDSAEVELQITLELPVEALIADLPRLFREQHDLSKTSDSTCLHTGGQAAHGRATGQRSQMRPASDGRPQSSENRDRPYATHP